MEAKRKKTRNIILTVLVLALAAGMAALPAILKSRQPEPEDKSSILSATAEKNDIRTTISGGGTLTEEEGVPVSVLSGVEISEYLVSNGDWVEKGQPVALVDKTTVMQTIMTVQDNLDYLARQLRRNPGTVGTDALYVPAPGRVKAVYAQKGDAVEDVMLAHGALATVSLDGFMAVELDVNVPAEINAGSDVTVILADGTERPGRIEVRQGRHITVLISDEGPAIGETVRVCLADGTELGSGELYVHCPWNAIATSGTVTYVAIAPEQRIGLRQHLFNLENVDQAETFRALSRQHREYEEAMEKLYALYADGIVTATESGRVSGVDKTKVGLVRQGEEDYVLSLLSAGDPDPNVDSPYSYHNKIAVINTVRFGVMLLYVEKDYKNVPDYTVMPNINTYNSENLPLASFSGVSVYGRDAADTSWIPITPSDLNEWDNVYLVYDNGGNLVMVLRPAPVVPSYGGGGGGGGEEQFDLFELKDVELLQVIPQNTMTVKVSIDELDILSVANGQEAEITVDALPGRSYTGVVSQVDPNGQNSGGNSKYSVTIAIDRDENMLSGMNATAILTVGVTENVLTLPAAALSEKGSRTVVYTGFDPESRTLLDPVEVETGVSDGNTVEILSGLEEGQKVWYSYYETEALPELFAGMPTEPA